MANIKDIVIAQLEAGQTVELDEFGVENVQKAQRTCRACGSHYKRTHGGHGSICYECGERWPEGSDVNLRQLIEKGFTSGLVEYRHRSDDGKNLDDLNEATLLLRTTPWTGIEFTYFPKTDEIVEPWRTIDDLDLEPEELIELLLEKVGTDE